MADVPYEGGVARTLPTATPPDNYQRVDARASQFGGAIGQGLERLGAGAEQAAREGFDLMQFYGAVSVDDQVNQTVDKVNRILNGDPNKTTQGTDGQGMPDTGYLGSKGRSALDRRQATQDQVESVIKSARDNLSSDYERASFDQQTRRMRTQWVEKIGSHSTREMNVWAQGVNTATAQRSINQIASDPDNTAENEQARQEYINAKVKQAQLQFGDDPTVKAEAIAGANRDLLKTQLTAIGAREPARALEILERNRDIAGAEYVNLEQSLRGRADQQAGIAFANRLMSGNNPARPYSNPEHPSFQSAANAAPGGLSPRGLARLVQIESSGDPNSANASDHVGLGQFSASTWKEFGEGDRRDPEASIRATARYAASNAKTLSRVLGRQPTDAELYLAHQQGPGGASKLLSNPNARAGDLVGDAAIRQNGGDPDAPASQFVKLWQTKFSGSGGNPIEISQRRQADVKAAIMNDPLMQERPQMMDAALGQVNKYFAIQQADETHKTAEFNQRVKDTTAEAMTTGTVQTPLTEAEFVERKGPEDGLSAYREYQKQLQLGTDMQNVATLAPDQQAALIDSYQPAPGDGFANQVKRKAVLQEAIAEVNKEKGADPAAFAIRRLPGAKAAFDQFNLDLSAAKTAEDRTSAAARYAETMIAEQMRVGVRGADIRLVPQSYVDAFNAKLTTPSKEGGTANISQQIEAEAKMWGQYWPDVYRQVSKDAAPVVRVIGSGVKSSAAQILTDVANVPTAQILKDQDDERANTIKKDVLDAMKPLFSSMAGNEGAFNVFNDFKGQAEKLAAVYVVGGMSSRDAAEKAYEDLVGFKYTFQDGYRVPKDIAFPTNDIRMGAVQFKSDAKGLNIRPSRDTVGGLSPEYIREADSSAISRDGKWVTSPDERGLMLVYNDRAVRNTQGAPIIISWSELAARGAAYRETFSNTGMPQP